MDKLLRQYLFELTERISRFYIHIDEIREQFYLRSDGKVTDKLSFLESYEQCLEKMLAILSEKIKIINTNSHLEDTEYQLLIKNCALLFEELTKLHENWLNHLPRPSEPVELRRFCRIIEKHVISFSSQSKSSISIYVSEKIGDETYAIDPIIEYKKGSFDSYLASVNNSLSSISDSYTPIAFFNLDNTNKRQDTGNKSNESIHITIPRIDASNPCHWPVLIHEVAHHLMQDAFADSNKGSDNSNASIDSEFFKYIDTLNIDINSIKVQTPSLQVHNNSFCIDINFKSWLTEVWCDLVAALSMGYSYWFAQFSAFINKPRFTYSEQYPPALFRLQLIKLILKHRFSRDVIENWEIVTNQCEDIIEEYNRLEGFSLWDDDTIVSLMECFQLYFLQKLFDKSDDGTIEFKNLLEDGLQNLVRYTSDIHLDVIVKLIENLDSGLPIPSITTTENSLYRERPTSVQEILCAASLYRNTSLKDEILKSLSCIIDNKSDDFSVKKFYKDNIEKKIKRFDQSILRSIQVSEWFHLYDLKDSYQYATNKESHITSSTLVDFQIVNLLLERKLYVVPIFSLSQQLGSTSLDIRLGTSFQVFSPNEYGVIDFADPNTVESSINNSKKEDLDYLKSIILMPNQFILGHSMEYLKLPDYVSARLEGRSSFARLGIQIHMTAGSIDPGFEGVLTYEIYNAGHSPVKLYPGLRIGQLIFSIVSEPIHSYSTKHSAKYNGLLEHHFSLQGRDYEIGKISNPTSK